MEINSAFNQGVASFQNASLQVTQASKNIAEVSAKSEDRVITDRSPTSITTELINMKVAEHQALASTQVIRSADEMLGSLIDTRV